MINRTIKYYSTCILLFLAIQGYSQDENNLIDSGYYYFNLEQYDRSDMFFQTAASDKANLDTKLGGITGLLRIAGFLVKIESADSLINIGDRLLNENKDISLIRQVKYKQSKAEFFRANAKYEAALNLHLEALVQIKVNSDSNLTANAYNYIAASFENLGALDSAIHYALLGRDLGLKLFPENDIKMASIYNVLGTCYYRTNQLSKSEENFLKTIDIVKQNIDGPSHFSAMAYGNLSNIYSNKGDYEEAINLARQAETINKKLMEPVNLSTNYYSLGVYYFYLGDFGRADDYLEKCVELRNNIYNDEFHYSLANPYNVLGIIFEESGQYQKAIKYLNLTKDIYSQSRGENSLDVATTNENIALCYASLGSLDSANYYINLATNIILIKAAKSPRFLSTHYHSLAAIRFKSKLYNDALSAIQKSNIYFKNDQLDNSPEFAQNIVLEANIYSEQGNFEQAQLLYEKALSKVKLNNQDTLSSESFSLIPITLTIINNFIEHAFRAYKKNRDPKYLKQVTKYSEFYLEISERFRKQFSDPYTKSIIAKNNAFAMEMGIGINYDLYKSKPSEALKKQILDFAEMSKTSLFRDLIDDYKIKSFAGIADSILQFEDSIKSVISGLNLEIIDAPNDKALKNNLFSAKEKLNSHIEYYSKENPKYYNLKFKNTRVSIEQIRKDILNNDDNLVEFMVDDTAYYAMLINKESIELYHAGNKLMVDSFILSWRNSLEQLEDFKTSQLSHKLYQQLFLPFEEKLVNNKLIIIPTGSLFYLNFEALNKTNQAGSFLILEYDIHYALSSTVLLEQSKNKAVKNALPTVIAPGFESKLKSDYEASIGNLEVIDEEYLNTVRQPWSVNLANHISKAYNGKSFVAGDATETNVKEHLSKSSLLHFATHAIANENDPLRSKLILAKDINENDRTSEDGYLHAYEFFNLNLQSELAVLTACESGIGNIQKGEGMISLAYSLNYAGCPSVIMSLWKIDEKTNTIITSQFYENLSKGNHINASLRSAKIKYIEEASTTLKHPFYWSGLVLMGNDSAIDLKSKTINWKTLLPIILLSIVILAAMLIRKKY